MGVILTRIGLIVVLVWFGDLKNFQNDDPRPDSSVRWAIRFAAALDNSHVHPAKLEPVRCRAPAV
jgi:hypothetical protein